MQCNCLSLSSPTRSGIQRLCLFSFVFLPLPNVGEGWGEGETGERHWIHLYAGSPIKNVGDKLAGMTERDKRLLL